MVVDRKKATYGQLDTKDRLSDLPDSIIHHIISYLGTEEACRTSLLSKRWAHIWSTGLILDFRPRFFVPKKDGEFVDGYIRSITGPFNAETVEKLGNFIESTMRRYSEKNLSIRKLRLEYPTIDQEVAGRIDEWVQIALRNQVEVLSLFIITDGFPSYSLPAILFLAKSLISVTLYKVRVPYFKNLKLISLQSLEMTEVDVDENMLQDIIMSCPLKYLKLDRCSGLENISIPCCSRLESLNVARTVPVGGTILVDTSSFQCCSYLGVKKVDPFPVILTPASKKNLKVLRIFCVFIADEFFGKLVPELPSVENMDFFHCTMPINVKIASQTLKELCIHDCYELTIVVIEAPNLDTFRYNGDLLLSSVINSHNKYNAHLHLTISNLDTGAFVGIKNLLSKSNCCCKVLSIILTDFRANAQPEIEFDKDLLNTIDEESPCDVQELKLFVKCFTSNLGESSCRAFIDGLLWCCRPDILSLLVTLDFDKTVIRTFLEILQEKVKCWTHPLKRVEIEGTSSRQFDLRLKLYW